MGHWAPCRECRPIPSPPYEEGGPTAWMLWSLVGTAGLTSLRSVVSAVNLWAASREYRLAPRLTCGRLRRSSVVSAIHGESASREYRLTPRLETGDPLNPITNSLHAISREIPGSMRVLEKISWNRNPHFQGSRGVTYWRTYWSWALQWTRSTMPVLHFKVDPGKRTTIVLETHLVRQSMR